MSKREITSAALSRPDDVVRYTYSAGRFRWDGCNECGCDFEEGDPVYHHAYTEEVTCSLECANKLWKEEQDR